MLYRSLTTMIARDGLTEALRQKIDLLYALGRLSDDEYKSLVISDAEQDEGAEVAENA